MKNQPLLNSNNDYIELDDIIQIRDSNNEIKQTINNKDKNKLLNLSSNYCSLGKRLLINMVVFSPVVFGIQLLNSSSHQQHAVHYQL